MFFSPAVTHVKVSLKGGVVSRSLNGLEQRNVISVKKWHVVKVASDTVNVDCEQCWPKYTSLWYTCEYCRAGRGRAPVDDTLGAVTYERRDP